MNSGWVALGEDAIVACSVWCGMVWYGVYCTWYRQYTHTLSLFLFLQLNHATIEFVVCWNFSWTVELLSVRLSLALSTKATRAACNMKAFAFESVLHSAQMPKTATESTSHQNSKCTERMWNVNSIYWIWTVVSWRTSANYKEQTPHIYIIIHVQHNFAHHSRVLLHLYRCSFACYNLFQSAQQTQSGRYVLAYKIHVAQPMFVVKLQPKLWI